MAAYVSPAYVAAITQFQRIEEAVRRGRVAFVSGAAGVGLIYRGRLGAAGVGVGLIRRGRVAPVSGAAGVVLVRRGRVAVVSGAAGVGLVRRGRVTGGEKRTKCDATAVAANNAQPDVQADDASDIAVAAAPAAAPAAAATVETFWVEVSKTNERDLITFSKELKVPFT